MKGWKITYSDYQPEEELLREALCTLGNGYFASRGAWESARAGEFHYKGTYLASGYNRLETEIAGKEIVNEDLVNWPDWTVLKFRRENGDWFQPETATIKTYSQVLDLKNGLLERTIRFEDEQGCITKLVSRRLVSMREPHLAAISWQLCAENWSGKIIVHSAIDGSVINSGVPRYRDLSSEHLGKTVTGSIDEDSFYLKTTTTESEITMVQAARTTATVNGHKASAARHKAAHDKYISQELELRLEEKQELVIEKVVAVYTSKDKAISNPLTAAKNAVLRATTFSEMLSAHAAAWSELWQHCDTTLEDDNTHDQLLLRLHIFHLLQTCSVHSIDLDAGIPARGWHGEAYRGHIFWDELFIFPFLNSTVPDLSRALLMYRYRRLGEARHAARAEGFSGAMFPWQSGSSGREETQVIHLNPESGHWLPDNTHLQRHVNAAIAYNVWQYFQTSGDLEFLSFYGAEIMLDIAAFWASMVLYNEKTKKYEIHNVVGPDEYHTSYPGSTEPGLRNNAYTNVMAAWSLMHSLQAIKKIDQERVAQLLQKLGLSNSDLERFDRISRNMFVPFIQNGMVIEQFEGFDKLQDLDWDKYHSAYGEVLRLDRILEKEGDSVNRYKAVKQADVMMLLYLFSAKELTEILQRQGYTFNAQEQIAATIRYYKPITSHGSTLSKLIFSWVFARSHREESWHSFQKALVSDFEDIQGGTTPEGIHLGAMAGTVDLIRRCYTGIEFRDETIWFNPQLPVNVNMIRFRIRYHGNWLEVELTHKMLKLHSHGGGSDKIKVSINNCLYKIKKGEQRVVELSSS